MGCRVPDSYLQGGTLSDDFETEPDAIENEGAFEISLESAISDAYPILHDRVRHAHFAGWHRRRGREEDLAHEATVSFVRHCRRHRRLPDDPVGYLIKIARNLAKKQYVTREKEPTAEAGCLPASLQDQGRLFWDEDDEESARLRSESRLELVRTGIEMLSARQRTAMELYLSEPGATHRELGLKMGLSEDGFQKNVDRGIEKIRQLLAEYGLIGPFPEE